MKNPSFSRGFTLIELLVVIAIIAILAVVVVLTLNPAQMLAQSRDANRLSDLATLNSAVNLYNTDQSGNPSYSLGIASTTYLSIADPSATSTAGTNCATMGLPATSTGWFDQCPASSTFRNVNGQGWVPVNFSAISSGAPFGALPIDPTNASSSLFYYTYTTNGQQYEFTVPLESQKYLKQNLLVSDPDPTREALGGAPGLVPQEEGLVGYWNFDEGTGSSTIDQSGSQNNGAWSGAAAGTSGYYSPGKVGPWAGTFNGASTYVNEGSGSALNLTSYISIVAWVNPSPSCANPCVVVGTNGVGSTLTAYDIYLRNAPGADIGVGFVTPDNLQHGGGTGGTVNYGQWNYLAMTFDGTTVRSYLNGVLVNSGSATSSMTRNFTGTYLGKYASGGYFSGLIDDARIYNRALSTAEIQAIYNAEK
jgi:prepilin-type N-terminal cleavage/methylation domain-containing protein